MEKPNPFLSVRVHFLTLPRGCTGLCIGYERGQWRAEQFADHVMEWLPEFALTTSECESMGHANSIAFIRRAARAVYTSKKFDRRGEFGELLLHIAIRQVFDSIPAISKIYYKSATNDTVKGFDAVHVVGPPDDMELWIGEAKFYDEITRAIYDVVKEIKEHTETNYLRNEFALIVNKIDDGPYSAYLRKLLDPNTSLDEVFSRACIPVLLTYDSDTVSSHNQISTTYIKAFESEIRKHSDSFFRNKFPENIRLHLFLLPLKQKEEFVAILDQKLKTWQKI